MKKNNTIILTACTLACLAGIAVAGSHYSAHAYLSAINVGPALGVRELSYLGAYTTTSGAYVELKAGGSTVYKVDTAQSTAVTNVLLSTTNGLAADDEVLIAHATGAVDYRVVAGTGASGLVTFTAAPSAALTTAARLWKIDTAGRYELPFLYSGSNTLTKTTLPLQLSGRLYQAAGIPFRLELSGTNCVLNATTAD